MKRIYEKIVDMIKNCAVCRFVHGAYKANKYNHVKINIRRGATQIGGSAVEITAKNGERIVLDLGLPLDAENNRPDLLPGIKGLTKKTSDLLAILISHGHQDHYGLGKWIDKKIPVYIDADANKIITAADEYLKSAGITDSFSFKNTVEIKGYKEFNIGPFTIKPYPVDHAAYNSYGFLIKVDDKKIFYTGDFRAHGRCNKRTEHVIKMPPKDVDVLLMEGSSIERLNPNQKFESEIDLEKQFKEKFCSTKGVAFVHASSQNIDRIVTIYKAAKASGRMMVITGYTGYILMSLGKDSLPNFTWKDVKKFSRKPKKHHEVSAEKIAEHPNKYVCIISGGNIDAFEKAGLLNAGALYVFSMWNGYRDDFAKPVIEKMHDHNVTDISIHTSGHADIPTLRKMVGAVKPKVLVPIHTFHPDRFNELFGDLAIVQMHADNEEFEV